MKALIVGAGLSGATAAFVLKRKGFDVEIFEERPHIAGNCFDYLKEKMTIHQYGPHSFHTNNKRTWDFINQFGRFKEFCHIVKANTPEGRIPLPFNKKSAEIVGPKTESEIVNLIFKDYSEKMWDIPWEQLPHTIKNRVPKIRDSYDSCYHDDLYRGLPINGYTEIVNAMLEGTTVHLNADKNICCARSMVRVTEEGRGCVDLYAHTSPIYQQHAGGHKREEQCVKMSDFGRCSVSISVNMCTNRSSDIDKT